MPDVILIIGGHHISMQPQSLHPVFNLAVVGEGEEPLRRFIDAFPDTEKISKIPNIACLNGDYIVNPRQAQMFPPMSI